MPKMSYEGLVGTVLALLVVILDQAGVKNPYVLWIAFILALFLCIDALIRSEWKKWVKGIVGIATIIAFIWFAVYLNNQIAKPNPTSQIKQPQAAPSAQTGAGTPASVPVRQHDQSKNAPSAKKPRLAPAARMEPPIQPSKELVVSTAAPKGPLPLQSPTTEELATAIAKKIAEQQPVPPPAPVKPCRGDELSACTDEALIEWGTPLIEKISRIQDQYMLESKISREFTGDKFLAAMEAAETSEADDYRDCCAEDALKYDKELISRIGGGMQQSSFTEWTQKLTQPVGSSGWKSARSGADTMILRIRYELQELVIKLRFKQRTPRH